MAEWSECPPLCITSMVAAGIKPAKRGEGGQQKPNVEAPIFHDAVSTLGMKQGKPFVPSAEFDRLYQEFMKNGIRRSN